MQAVHASLLLRSEIHRPFYPATAQWAAGPASRAVNCCCRTGSSAEAASPRHPATGGGHPWRGKWLRARSGRAPAAILSRCEVGPARAGNTRTRPRSSWCPRPEPGATSRVRRRRNGPRADYPAFGSWRRLSPRVVTSPDTPLESEPWVLSARAPMVVSGRLVGAELSVLAVPEPALLSRVVAVVSLRVVLLRV